MIHEITASNIDSYSKEDKLLLIDFWAEWCVPCKALAPMVDEIANEYGDRANIGKCDVEENDSLTVKYKIRNVPTIILVKNGVEVDRSVGAVSKTELMAKIDANL